MNSAHELRSALSGLFVSMRNFEMMRLPNTYEVDGMFSTFTVHNVQLMLRRVLSNESRIEDLPSFDEVMVSVLRLEVMSLIQVNDVVGQVVMSKREVRTQGGRGVWGTTEILTS